MAEILDLSGFFVTRSQANEFVRGISNIIDQMYEVNFNLENSFAREFGIDKRDKFIELLHENTHKNLSLKDYLTNIIEEIKILPELNMTIAFEPSNEILKAISQWFIITYNKQVILNIEFDRSLIAGATINYNGKYKDYSVKSLFNQIVNSQLNPPKSQPNNQAGVQHAEYMTIGR